MVRATKFVSSVMLLTSSTALFAAETTTYTYDAKGRLVRVVKSGGPNNGTTTNYSHDKVDNRVRVSTSGAPR